VAADGRGKGRARRVCNRSGDPPVGTLGRGSAGQNAEGAEPRVERCPYAFLGVEKKKHVSLRPNPPVPPAATGAVSTVFPSRIYLSAATHAIPVRGWS
jgi:hypothetical protein